MLDITKHLRFVDYEKFEKINDPIEKAQISIKKFILWYALCLWSRIELLEQINRVLKELGETLVKVVPNTYKEYLGAIYIASMTWVNVFYSKFSNVSSKSSKGKVLQNPKQAIDNIKETDESINEDKVDYETIQYGVVDVENYEKKVMEYVKELAEEEAGTVGSKSSISLSAKAEIDIRHEHQQKMIQKLIDNGDLLCWFSSHADCSKRCQKWQGKLCHLTLPAIDDKMWTGKKDKKGRKIYSFTAITNQVDKYGYKNNIIVGFNCRHRLIPYGDGTKPEDDYKDDTIEKYRKINEMQRLMERTISKLVQQYKLIKVVNSKVAKSLKQTILKKYQEYVEFSKRNNRPYYPYRCGLRGFKL